MRERERERERAVGLPRLRRKLYGQEAGGSLSGKYSKGYT